MKVEKLRNKILEQNRLKFFIGSGCSHTIGGININVSGQCSSTGSGNGATAAANAASYIAVTVAMPLAGLALAGIAATGVASSIIGGACTVTGFVAAAHDN